jgi:hypothetical protein
VICVHQKSSQLANLLTLGLVVLTHWSHADVPQAPDHWAFQPIERPTVPGVAYQSWATNSIDRFVLARLEANALTPSSTPDPQTLIRRAFVDLTGLPPTIDEVEAFRGDSSPDAFVRVIDRLLARRGYGERWGRHWLDVARYADAKGYVDGGEARYPFAYTYRDYVVEAFNRDLPYDQFVREQIAADRMAPSENHGSLAALGFLTTGSRYNFFPHEIIDDRIDVVTRGFLGLSMSCARCHDHKFDPISANDYYALYRVFWHSREPNPSEMPRLSAAGSAEDNGFEKKLAETAQKYARLRAELHAKATTEMRAWAGDYLRYVVQTTPEHRTKPQAELRTKRGLIREVSAYSSGAVRLWRTFLTTRSPNDPVFGLWSQIWKLKRESIERDFPAILSRWKGNILVIAAFEQYEASVISMEDLANVYGSLLEETEAQWQLVLKTDGAVTELSDADEEVRQALYGPEAAPTVTLEESIDLYTLDESVEERKHFADIERVFLEKWGDVAPRPMALADKTESLEQHVFLRGDPKREGEFVEPVIPASLSNGRAVPITNGSGRLELAGVITHPQNPLTARVIANRIWHWHFGAGLVSTPSDFGTRSEPPTHPELLDFLASWLIDHDWSLKGLHRLILQSNTWQQASVDRPECREKDPSNKLLWRMNRRRLGFEAMRDSMLFVSGQMEPCGGGPPVLKRPDDITHRKRTLYSYIDREKLHEIYRVFDFPSPDITAPERARTTVPQQALFLLNNPFVIAQAEAACNRAGTEDKSLNVTATIRRLYQSILSRNPDSEEVRLASRFVQQGESWTDLAQTLMLSNEFLFLD